MAFCVASQHLPGIVAVDFFIRLNSGKVKSVRVGEKLGLEISCNAKNLICLDGWYIEGGYFTNKNTSMSGLYFEVPVVCSNDQFELKSVAICDLEWKRAAELFVLMNRGTVELVTIERHGMPRWELVSSRNANELYYPKGWYICEEGYFTNRKYATGTMFAQVRVCDSNGHILHGFDPDSMEETRELLFMN